MKKVFAIVVTVALASVLFAGCSVAPNSVSQDQLDQLVQSISGLKTQVDDIQSNLTTNQNANAAPSAPSETPATEPAAPSTAPTANAPASAQTTKTAADYDVAGLVAQADALIKEMDTTTVANYLAMDRKVDALDDAIEFMEDQAELDYYQGLLSMADYQKVKGDLDALDLKLDHAKDTLELRLGIDD